MSTCISRHGEYSAHIPGDDWNCTRCFALDENGLRAELDRTTADLAVAAEVARERGQEVERLRKVAEAYERWSGNPDEAGEIAAAVRALREGP